MTEPSDESLEPKSTANDLPATPESGLPAGESATEPTAAQQAEDEGLPEWEPLTPELVEDEAIRGDFVIRWVVVGLALLLGISQISETRSLIHLTNGQYLLSHGLLPGAKDVFSYTASDRKWVNLSWLYDITVAAVYSLGGGIGLSILQGIFACVTFGLLVHSVRSNIRTWWGSVCAALALLACYAQFTIQPELITLLGMSFLLWTLVQSEEAGQSGRLWSIVPAIWLWAQFDQRAWFGCFLLFLWAIGERFSRDALTDGGKRLLGTITIASFVVVAVHPFLWESWLAPFRLYLTDYPAMQFAYQRPTAVDQVFYPIWSKFIWMTIHHRIIAALALAFLTLVTMFLNRAQVRFSHVLAFIGFNAMGLFATHELSAASLVNCVVCTLNAQAWYREKFGQVYSIDWRELLFSRGGRAVTVLGFFAFAWLILSGRLDGPGGKRTGLGFDTHLANAMRDYRSLNSGLIDDHPFNFSVRQGDLMIWGGQKTFVDSRVGLFYGSRDSNLLELHSKTRLAMQQKREQVEGTGTPTIWKAIFDKYQIRQAWPRMNGPVPPPDYTTFFDLISSADFQLNRMNSSTAVFLRMDQPDDTTKAFLKDHSFDVVQQAFRTNLAGEDQPREWSKPATAYDDLFSLRRPIVPGGVQAATHYLQLAAAGGNLSHSQRMAFALLAIRSANEGLRNEPNSADGYRVLGLLYSVIGQLESAVLGQGGPPIPNTLRYYQSIAAFQQALSLQPDDIPTIRQLLQQYEITHRLDVQLELVTRLKRLQPYSRTMTDEQSQDRERVLEFISRLEEPVSRIDSMVAKHLDDGSDRFQVAVGAYQAGGLLRAITTLEEDAIYLAKNPQAKLVLGNWLMEAGRGREAGETFEALETIAGNNSLPGWRGPAAVSSLATANYPRSIKLWSDDEQFAMDSQLPTALLTLPFVTLNPAWMGPSSYPTTLTSSAAQLIQEVRIDGAFSCYQKALAQVESGATDDAAKSIRRALELDPNSQMRPLLRFYLECLTGEQIPLKVERPAVEEFTDLTEPEVKSNTVPEVKSETKPQ